jgi:hypothetical protein
LAVPHEDRPLPDSPNAAAPLPIPAALKPVPGRPATPLTPVSLPELAARAPPPIPAQKPVAIAPILPEPTAMLALPNPATLPAPMLKPAALPSEPATQPATQEVAAPLASPPPALQPLGPALAVTAPPNPPAVALAPFSPPSSSAKAPVTADRTSPSAAPNKSNGLELSDIWHPGRAVRKGLDWAGDQVPSIGSGPAAPPPPPRATRPSAPISLLPAPEKVDASDTPPHKPAAPGPGSGGLY